MAFNIAPGANIAFLNEVYAEPDEPIYTCSLCLEGCDTLFTVEDDYDRERVCEKCYDRLRPRKE